MNIFGAIYISTYAGKQHIYTVLLIHACWLHDLEETTSTAATILEHEMSNPRANRFSQRASRPHWRNLVQSSHADAEALQGFPVGCPPNAAALLRAGNCCWGSRVHSFSNWFGMRLSWKHSIDDCVRLGVTNWLTCFQRVGTCWNHWPDGICFCMFLWHQVANVFKVDGVKPLDFPHCWLTNMAPGDLAAVALQHASRGSAVSLFVAGIAQLQPLRWATWADQTTWCITGVNQNNLFFSWWITVSIVVI